MNFQDYCIHNDISISFVKFDNGLKGMCYHCGGEYHILLNDRISDNQKIKTLKHELLHIINNHFHRELTVEQCEEEVNKYIDSYQFDFIEDYSFI